jgi:hypothetical protein
MLRGEAVFADTVLRTAVGGVVWSPPAPPCCCCCHPAAPRRAAIRPLPAAPNGLDAPLPAVRHVAAIHSDQPMRARLRDGAYASIHVLGGAPVRARVYSCMYSTYAPTRVCMRRPRATAWVRAGGELHEERRCDDAALRVARRKEAMRSAAVPQGLGHVLPHLHRDCAHPCHICTGTGLTPATSALGLGSPLPAGTLRHDRSCRWTA